MADAESPSTPKGMGDISPEVAQAINRERARSKQIIEKLKVKLQADSEAKLKKQQAELMKVVEQANGICDELKEALTKEHQARGDAER
eukprot:SAG31_NODE_8666_length_1410_cov_1.893974_1_plen_87_part_10